MTLAQMDTNFQKLWEYISKILLSACVFFLSQIYLDFKDIKVLVNQVVLNQTIMDRRVSSLESKSDKNDNKWTEHDQEKLDFFKRYQLVVKQGE